MRILKQTVIRPLEATLCTSLVLVADNHGVPDARLLVQAMLQGCDVRALILEVPSDCEAPNSMFGNIARGKYGSSLRVAAGNMSKMLLSAEAATRELEKGGYFTTPDPYAERGRIDVGQDVGPNLRALAGIAVSMGIPVVPCDTNYRQVLNKLQSDVGLAPLPNNALYAGDGLAYRDKQTARCVKEFIEETQIRSGLLMLWGSDHIRSPKDRSRSGLRARLFEAGIRVSVLSHPARFLTEGN